MRTARVGSQGPRQEQDRPGVITIVQDELGDPRLTADYLGHHGLGSVAGYTEISTARRAEAGDALTSPRDVAPRRVRER